jgi:hypothetical protein
MPLRNFTATRFAFSVAFAATAGAAQATTVSAFDSSFQTYGDWFVSAAASGGTSSIGVAPAGGPLPSGAAKLTTDGTNASKTEVSVADTYGKAASLAGGISLHYSYFKDTVNGNAAVTPSIKLTFLNSTYGSTPGNDGYVTLIYEPYWNPLGSLVPFQTWTPVDIDYTTGLFWTTAGFGQPNGAGGPPLKTLADWVTTFDASSGNAFSAADLIQLSVGIGSYTPNQVGYFDDVRLSIARTTYDASYDFEATSTQVPEPGSLTLVALGLIGVAALRRKKA